MGFSKEWNGRSCWTVFPPHNPADQEWQWLVVLYCFKRMQNYRTVMVLPSIAICNMVEQWHLLNLTNVWAEGVHPSSERDCQIAYSQSKKHVNCTKKHLINKYATLEEQDSCTSPHLVKKDWVRNGRLFTLYAVGLRRWHVHAFYHCEHLFWLL